MESEGGYVWPLLGLVLTRLAGLIAMLKTAEEAVVHMRPEAGWLLRTRLGSGHAKLWRGLAAEVLAPSRSGRRT